MSTYEEPRFFELKKILLHTCYFCFKCSKQTFVILNTGKYESFSYQDHWSTFFVLLLELRVVLLSVDFRFQNINNEKRMA